MTDNSVPTQIVDKLIDTIQEHSKQVTAVTLATQAINKELSTLSEVTKKYAEQFNTPPRNIELSEKMVALSVQLAGNSEKQLKELETVDENLSRIHLEIKSLAAPMKKTVRWLQIVLAGVGIIALIATIVTNALTTYQAKVLRETVGITEPADLDALQNKKLKALEDKIDRAHPELNKTNK